ncbi:MULTISPECIES: teichoic acid D-Ala incorporation-associated protein DltX [Lactobacillaceae]|nr:MULTISPECIES: teichoic acid D-Ala incorporation-associated protein DltX [Lactobacillaceae]
MKNKIINFFKRPSSIFVLKTVVFFIIFVIILYIYGYNGAGSSKFIYNEF